MKQSKQRKKFFIKGNFQRAFITGFILFLLVEVVAAAVLIYKFSSRAIEESTFKSHLLLDTSTQILAPIIFKVNIWIILLSIFFSCLAMTIAYFRLCALFDKMIGGFKNLKNNNTSFRLEVYGRKNTRELIKEFNKAASCLDQRRRDLENALDSLFSENELKQIIKKHDKFYSLITDKPPR